MGNSMKNYLLKPPTWFASAILFAMFATGTGTSEAVAQTGHQFEGAVWRFTMAPKFPRAVKRQGAFRVADNKIFQKTKSDDKDFSKEIGVNKPDGNKTRIELKDFRTFEIASGGGLGAQNRIDGTALLKMNRFGEWSGRFIDGDGKHWEFQCSRVVE